MSSSSPALPTEIALPTHPVALFVDHYRQTLAHVDVRFSEVVTDVLGRWQRALSPWTFEFSPCNPRCKAQDLNNDYAIEKGSHGISIAIKPHCIGSDCL